MTFIELHCFVDSAALPFGGTHCRNHALFSSVSVCQNAARIQIKLQSARCKTRMRGQQNLFCMAMRTSINDG